MTALLQDLRHGARRLARSPGFTAVAALTLALGIGANSAIFSVVDAVLLRPLPYGDPERLVLVWDRMERSAIERAPVSAPDLADFRQFAQGFTGFAATNNVGEVALTGDGPPEQIKVANVTGNFFDVLGVAPRLGRGFEPADDVPIPPGAFQGPPAELPPTAMLLTDGLWRRRFGGDPGVVGKAVWLNGQPMTVIGVLPPGYELLMPPDAGMPTDVDAYSPLRIDLASGPRDNQWLRVIARLAPGTTLAEAQAEMDAIAARHREEHVFHSNMGIGVEVRSMHGDVVHHVRPALVALLGAVGFVLLIACANVANLLLARSAVRRREMAVRAALGAGRGRLFRQVLSEGVLLAVPGALLGLGLAWVGVRLLLALRPPGLPRLDEVGLDPRVLAFTLAAAVAAALLATLAPALSASLERPGSALAERGGDGMGGATGGRLRLRGALVVAEVALSLVLLIGAGLMLRSFLELSRVRPGFDPEGALTYKLSLPFPDYPTPEARTGFFRRMEERVAAAPGVEAVGSVFPMPLGGRFWTGPYGRAEEPEERWSEQEADFRVVTPGYFDAMGIRLLAGRALAADDLDQRRAVAVVDASLASRLWPEGGAVGERVGIDLFGEKVRLEVVGTVEPVRHAGITEPPRETIYLPLHFMPWAPMTVAVRTAADPETLAGPVRAGVRALDPGLAVYAVRPLAAYVREALAATRFTLVLAAVFAGLALALAAIGLAGVLAYAVRRRRHEIGVRVALGARPGDVVRLVVGRGLLLVGLGIVLGLAAALAVSRSLSGLLYGVTATDPATYAALAGLLAAVAVAASWVPAQRAARIDPVTALRAE
jgi:putative ABC transport system permease protein